MTRKLIFFLSIFLSTTAFAGESVSKSWDATKPVNEKTVFFGETERGSAMERGEPSPGDKSYPWFWLERGNNYLVAGKNEKAAMSFQNAYAAGGTAKVLSGFKLVETLEIMGNIDEAIVILEDLKQNHLVSNQEFGQAQRLRSRLEDQKRKRVVKPAPAFDGHAWLLYPQPERMRYVLDAMQELRSHGIPLAESAQQYAFHLDEYFIAHPAEPAGDGPDVLSRIIYETDSEARIPIDRWRINPSSTVYTEPVQTGNAKFTGAQWIVMTHEDKAKYVLGAMAVMRQQNVPMKRTPYAYEYDIDDRFTNKPELPAADSVVTFASLLYDTEPEAREVLEALRLK